MGLHRRRRRVRYLLGAATVLGVMLWPRNAPATIAEQRARLPPAAECADENVAGVWRSHTYHPGWMAEWSVFTLVIRRSPNDPEQLVGQISNHFWHGGSQDEEPPPCRPGGYERTVEFAGRGYVRNGNEIFFGGVGQWRETSSVCGYSGGGYNLDNFSGVIDPSILEFQSVNNDGGIAVNDPIVFRRIRCPPMRSAESPTVSLAPPAFYPERRGGCGR